MLSSTDCFAPSQLAPPKSKYIEHILIATHSGEHGVAEVFRALQNRLRDSTWTVVFKGLITVHLMIREGSPDVTLEFLSSHKNMLATSSFTDGMYKVWQPKRMCIQCVTAGRIVYHSRMGSLRTLLIVPQFKRMARIFATIQATLPNEQEDTDIANAILSEERRITFKS